MSFDGECTTSGVENASTTDKGLEATSRTQDLNKKPEIVKNATNTENNATNAKLVVSKQKSKKSQKQVREKSETHTSKKENRLNSLDWENVRGNIKQAFKDSDSIMVEYGFKNQIR